MPSERLTTALLGKAGELRDRLESALREAGAELVVIEDPMAAREADVLAARPRNVVVLMEPGVDEALDRFDAIFDDPNIELLFEEASVLAARQGWDVARWGRHLAAKLRGSDDVLPAGHGDDAGFVAPQPRDALKSRATAGDASSATIQPASGGTSDLAFAPAAGSPVFEPLPPAPQGSEAAMDLGLIDPVPTGGAFADLAFEQPAATVPAPTQAPADDFAYADFAGLELDPAPAVPAFEPLTAQDEPITLDLDTFSIETPAVPAAAAPAAFGDGAFVGDWMPPAETTGASRETAEKPAPGFEELDFSASDFMDAAALIPDATPQAAAASAPLPAAPVANTLPSLELALDDAPIADMKPMASAAAMDAPDMTPKSFESWSLVGADEVTRPAAPRAAEPASRLDGMSLVDDGTVGLELTPGDAATAEVTAHSEASAGRGAVVISAGMGGPDPLRALLGHLPQGFTRPVLIQQYLDAGNYDRLARQMERATQLPVKLATAGDVLSPGTVYVMPVALGVEPAASGLQFAATVARGFADLTSVLDPADSALLVLSGAPIELVDSALRFKVAGAWVAAQAEPGCFDHAVPAMVARGGADIDEPMGLARRLGARWHS